MPKVMRARQLAQAGELVLSQRTSPSGPFESAAEKLATVAASWSAVSMAQRLDPNNRHSFISEWHRVA